MKNLIKKTMILPLALALPFAISCGEKDPSFSLFSETDNFTQFPGAASNKVDVLFVINDQPSMSSFQDELVTSMGSFMQVFESKGFDFKISVVTTSAYLADPTLSGYDPADAGEEDFNDYNGSVYSGVFIIDETTPDLFDVFAINAKPSKNSSGQDSRSFSSMRQALQTNRPINQGFMREDAFLAVVIIDNGEDYSGNGRCSGCNQSGRYNAPTLDPVQVYIDFLDDFTGSSGDSRKYSVSTMTQSETPCQGGSNMVRIMDLADQTNGVIGDICQADFGPSLAEISNKIATLSTKFYLDREPVESSIEVFVNGSPVPNSAENGWTYDSAAIAIEFHGSGIPSSGDSIGINYDPVTVK